MIYKDYNDYELLNFIAENNDNALDIIYKKYEPVIVNLAQRYFFSNENLGLEINDFIQEGRIGLNNAINNYSDTRDTLFYTYAISCIEKKMTTTIVTAKRKKHKILNESLSIDNIQSDKIDYIKNLNDANVFNPENLVIDEIEQDNLIKQIKSNLTLFENDVFELKINGFDYKEIANKLDKNLKQVDNALQRIKYKINYIIKNKNN